MKIASKDVLYYTTSQRIGRAVAEAPLGPFHDDSTQPLVAQTTPGGSIDASPFRDADGTLYLYWKNDGNTAHKTGETNDQIWEGHVVEGPTMCRHDGKYFLFYSGGDYAADDYAVGYATCAGPLGPCRDAPENPILNTACRAHGPGYNALLDADGTTWIVYHSWDAAHTKRTLWLSRLDWKHGRPVVDGPC
jgi:beta-xylosidase